ncbi:MAG: sulfotransferase [Bryobacteraceae bacterium]
MNHLESGTRVHEVRVPVFVVGLGRSGTTLLRVALNRHSQLAVCGETNYFHFVYVRRRAFGDPADPRNREGIINAYLSIRKIPKLGMDMAALRERLLREGVNWRAMFQSMLQEYAESQGKIYTGEKSPKHTLHVKTLCEWFPCCSIVHIVRDPRDAVSSAIRMPWANRSVLVGARQWRLFNQAALAVADRDNYLRVRYEDLAAQPEEQLRRICNHIGIAYEAEMLNPSPVEAGTRAHGFRAFERITTERIALWRTELKPWQAAAIEAVAGRWMEKFGYERQNKRVPLTSLARAGVEALVEMAFTTFFRLPWAFYRLFHPASLADEFKWKERASADYARRRLPLPEDPATKEP